MCWLSQSCSRDRTSFLASQMHILSTRCTYMVTSSKYMLVITGILKNQYLWCIKFVMLQVGNLFRFDKRAQLARETENGFSK